MAVVTYVLLSGYLLGLRNEFSPERLGLQASSALMWLTLEVLAVWLATYILSIRSNLRVLDLVAFSSYKFVAMIAALLASMLLYRPGYLLVLSYGCFTLDFFLVSESRYPALAVSTITTPASLLPSPAAAHAAAVAAVRQFVGRGLAPGPVPAVGPVRPAARAGLLAHPAPGPAAAVSSINWPHTLPPDSPVVVTRPRLRRCSE